MLHGAKTLRASTSSASYLEETYRKIVSNIDDDGVIRGLSHQ